MIRKKPAALALTAQQKIYYREDYMKGKIAYLLNREHKEFEYEVVIISNEQGRQIGYWSSLD